MAATPQLQRPAGFSQPGEEKEVSGETSQWLSTIINRRKNDLGNSFKVKEVKFTLDTRWKFFTQGAVRCWHRLT